MMIDDAVKKHSESIDVKNMMIKIKQFKYFCSDEGQEKVEGLLKKLEVSSGAGGSPKRRQAKVVCEKKERAKQKAVQEADDLFA